MKRKTRMKKRPGKEEMMDEKRVNRERKRGKKVNG